MSQFSGSLSWLKFRNDFYIDDEQASGTCGESISWDEEGVVRELKSNGVFKVKLQGYYMLEVGFDVTPLLPKRLFLHVDSLASSKELYTLNFSQAKIAKRVCYFPNPTDDIGLSFSGDAGTIEKFSIRLVKMTGGYAGNKMESKLAHLTSKNDSLKKVEGSLWVRYNRILNMDSNIGYSQWIADVEPTTWLKQVSEGHLYSIIVPVYKTPISLLKACVNSVISQTYKRWELILVDDFSDSDELTHYLNFLQSSSKKIKIIHKELNSHISATTNSGVDIATGDYIAFLDHDDLLSPNALNEIESYVVSNPSKKIIYSDEDKIDVYGDRVSPYFKPDFNYELILSHNYMSHFSVVTSSVVRELGGLRVGFEGAQDYDLMLRCINRCGSSAIGHVPKVLYHWRMVEGSTALASSEKDYCTQAGLKAIQDYLLCAHPLWSAEVCSAPNTFKVVRDIADGALVSIVIPTRDQSKLLKLCINSILGNTSYKNYEIIIVDNGSEELAAIEYLSSLASYKNIQVVSYNKPFNYSEINNFAVKNFVNGEYVLLMNNDIEIINEDWLGEMLMHACQADIGCVGAKLLYPNNTIQHAGVTLGIGGVAGHTHKHFPGNDSGYFSQLALPREVSAITAAALLVRKSIFDEAGGLDEVNLKVAFNDVDFCLKVKALGFRNIWTPYAQMYHHESVSRGYEDTPEKKYRFQREVEFMKVKWGDTLNSDPFYNPNLSLTSEDFSIRSLS